MKIKTRNWAIAIGYVLLIYATLGIVRGPITYLRELGILRISLLSTFILCFLILLGLLIHLGAREIWRYAGLLLIFGCYFLISREVSSPEEQIHFIQYGLVGVLFMRALQSHHLPAVGCYFLAMVLGSLAGWVDEIFQGILPSRYYDVRDIILNAVSTFLGLVIHSLFPLKNKRRKFFLFNNFR